MKAETDRSTGAWVTIALCFAAAVLEGFDIQAIGIAAPRLGPELGLAPPILGKALAASNIGLVFGAAVGGWLADVWGRKPVMTLAVAVFGAFTLATTFVPNFEVLFAVRLCVGLGFGAALANIVAIAAEVAPPGRRGATATMMFCGMPLGGGIVALIAALNPEQDWRTLFLIGGILPLLLVPALFFLLRETHTGAAKDPSAPRVPTWFWIALVPLFLLINLIAQPLNKESADGLFLTWNGGPGFNLDLGDLLRVASPWLALIATVVISYVVIHRRALLGEGRASASVLLWINFLPTLIVLYLILNWLPTLVRGKGFVEGASWASVWFNFGSVAGALALGRIVDRFGMRWPVTLAYLGLIGALVALALAGNLFLILVMSGLVGFTMMGANYSMYGVAASYYPTALRGRGAGAVVAWGRLGSVAAPLLGGYLLGGGVSSSAVVMWMALPAVVAGLAVLLLSVVARPVAD